MLSCSVFACLFLQQAADANSKKDMQKLRITTKDWSFLFCQSFRAASYNKVAQKSPRQETCLGNRGRLKVLNDTKLVKNEHE